MYQVSRSLGVIWHDLKRNTFFRVGLFFKLLLIAFLLPTIQQDWFVPFVVHWIENPAITPWSGYLMSDGDPLSFPYGPIMAVFHLPGTLIGWSIDRFFEVSYFSGLGFRIGLLGADTLLLMLLLQTFEKYWKQILIFYWLSPLVLFITYWHGQIDIVPVMLFFYSLALIRQRNFGIAGLVLASSIAAKHSMIIGAPFIVLYLWSRNGLGKQFLTFISVFIIALALVEAPLLISDAFNVMVINNREVEKLYWLNVDMGSHVSVYLTPVMYLLLLYLFWRIKIVNFDLLIATMGVAFSVIILTTPSSPGWYLWLVPILAIHQSRHGYSAVVLVGIFSLLLVVYYFINASGAIFLPISSDISWTVAPQNSIAQSFHYTLIIGTGLLVAVQMLRLGVRKNDYYHLGRKPISIGIAGDAGVGKSAFSDSLSLIFGKRLAVQVCGDDYYNWDRLSPMWSTLTSLNPKANKLFDLVKDVRSLIGGDSIQIGSYNSESGRFSPKETKIGQNLILVSGVHALYPPQLSEELDVCLFIEVDRSLESYIDKKHGGKKKLLPGSDTPEYADRRKLDVEKYIQPQSSRADVVFKLLPINIDLVGRSEVSESNIKLQVKINSGIYYQELVKVLVGICGLQVRVVSIDEKGVVIMEISGDMAAEDVSLAVNMLVPHMGELFDFAVKFDKGVQGIMQIITLMAIDELLKRRRLL